MWKKIIALIASLLIVLFIAINWLLSSIQLQRIGNYFLAPDFSLQLADNVSIDQNGLNIPNLSFSSQSCQLINLQNIHLNNWFNPTISVQKATLDYHCLMQLPAANSSSDSSLNIISILPFIPDGEINIQSLQLINAEQVSGILLQQLIQSQAQLRLIKQKARLQLTAELNEQDTTIFQLNTQLDNLKLTGLAQYRPNYQQDHQLNFQINLNEDITQLPKQGELLLNWVHPELALSHGVFSLQWQDQQGQVKLQDLVNQTEMLNLPFTLQENQIQIQQGNFYWNIGEQQPLQGVLNLTLKKITEAWLPLKTDIRISILSSGAQGKGNIVIYGSDGEIGKAQMNIPLEAHGNVKYDDSIAYTDVVFKLEGSYSDPTIHFHSPSMLRVTGRGHDLSLNVRVPLDNVIIGRYGVKGRLQAMLQGNTAQFSDLELHLDGQANEFIAGIKSIFDIRDSQNKIRATEDTVANLWEWNLSGKGIARALKTSINLSGKGFWLGNQIEIQQLEGYSGEINTAGIKIPKTELKLTDNLRWYYEDKKISGMMQVQAPSIALNYGGHFVKPIFTVSLNGEDITDFNLAGELIADALGPIKIFSHYYDQKLVGNIYWPEQSAKVFQSLFPAKWNWNIQDGTIRGQTAFDVTTASGIQMGGHFAIRSGEISLPDGKISGIEFALPYRYINNSIELINNPVQVFVQHIKNEGLELENIRVKVQGYYPYSYNKPLTLSELNVDLMGGQLSVNQFALPQQNVANLNLQQIDLAKVLEFLQYNHLEMKGTVDAVFPFWLEGKSCIICNGKISHIDNISIKLSEEMVKGLKQGGWTESILVDMISEMNLQQLNAEVNITPTGIMNLKTQIKGYNPTKKTENPIILNYNHQENIYELWKLVDYNSQFKQKLEHRIYQRLKK